MQFHMGTDGLNQLAKAFLGRVSENCPRSGSSS